jgi:hypothetical protein
MTSHSMGSCELSNPNARFEPSHSDMIAQDFRRDGSKPMLGRYPNGRVRS